MRDSTGASDGHGMADWAVFEAWRHAVDARLEAVTRSAGDDHVVPLSDAIRYAARTQGKRLRALLLLSCVKEFSADVTSALDAACAVEMIHAASLVFDDLPSMDNATLRRGQPANHVVYGESTAILGGIAMLSQAFGLVATMAHAAPANRTRMVASLTEAVGVRGLAGGQWADLEQERRDSNGTLSLIHARKTGALFAAAAECGGLLTDAEEPVLDHLRGIGLAIGLAFQAFDDVLDVAGSPGHTGKDVGQDRRFEKFDEVERLTASRSAIQRHLQDVDGHIAAIAPGNGPLKSYMRHLRGALERHLSKCVTCQDPADRDPATPRSAAQTSARQGPAEMSPQ